MSVTQQIHRLLKKNRLSITGSRLKILELFLHQDGALAHADIEKKSGSNFDRVTVYRTLQTFVEKGIVHTIPTADNSVLYALCKDDCCDGRHYDRHVHFLCRECNTTVCLDDINVPDVKLPKGFDPEQVEVVVKGICKKCANG